jgi:indolepyruvate ferredoxin oxidoreductase beta subunit
MEKNIIVAGVGGQGILSIAFVIDHAAMDAGFHFKQAEVHGMAQRGGAVQSNLRYADREIFSDLIPAGKADLVLSVEPLEALRYRQYLRPDGWVVTSTTPFVNIPDYPESDTLLGKLAALEHVIMVDTAHLARAAGNRRAQNMVAVGAASPMLDFEESRLLVFVERLFARKGEKLVAVNQRAFRLGRAAGLFFRHSVAAGLAKLDSLRLLRKFDPDSIDPAQAEAWAAAIEDDAALLDTVLGSEGTVACDHVSLVA